MDQLMEKVDAIPEQPCDDEKAQEGGRFEVFS